MTRFQDVVRITVFANLGSFEIGLLHQLFGFSSENNSKLAQS